MSREDFRIMIADVPNKEEPVCEIYYKDKGWIQISAEIPNKFVIAFCNTDKGSYWEFPYEEAISILEEAKQHFAKFQRTPEAQEEYDDMKKEQENWNPTTEETAEYERKMEELRKKYYG